LNFLVERRTKHSLTSHKCKLVIACKPLEYYARWGTWCSLFGESTDHFVTRLKPLCLSLLPPPLRLSHLEHVFCRGPSCPFSHSFSASSVHTAYRQPALLHSYKPTEERLVRKYISSFGALSPYVVASGSSLSLPVSLSLSLSLSLAWKGQGMLSAPVSALAAIAAPSYPS